MCDGSGCTECANTTDVTYNLASGACFVCSDSNCTACAAAAATCTACKSGFALVSAACQACSAGCSICETSAICSRCSDGFFLSSAPCVTCNVNPNTGCDECTSAGCTDCETGKGLASDNTCHACTDSSKCETCNGAAGTCTECKAVNPPTTTVGYVLEAGTCYDCLAGCMACTYATKGTICDTCTTGFSKASGNTCFSCDSTCATCGVTNDPNECLTCNPVSATDFRVYLTSAKNCLGGCAALSSATACTTCTASGNTQINHLHTNGVCYLCNVNCATCQGTGTTDCLTCKDGFQGATTDTPAACADCNSDGAGTSVCKTCTAPAS